MTRLLLGTLLACSIQSVHGAEAPALIDRPNPSGGPTQVSVGIWVVDINSIDSAQQTFTADIAVVLTWKDGRLAHSGQGVTHYPLEQIWNPRVGIANETNSVNHRFPDSVEVNADGTVLYRQLYVGSFSQPLHLKSFPFDKQNFRVHLVAVRYSADEVEFVPNQKWIDSGLRDAAGIAPSITLPDWRIEKWNVQHRGYSLSPGLEYAGYLFEFTASRNVQHYIWKVILPLVLIVIMSWAVFWIDPKQASSQINIAITSMLTLIAYRFSVGNDVPRLPYTTRLDAFILTSTLLVFFSLIEVLITAVLDDNHRTAQSKKIDRYCRAVFPAIFVIASIFIFAHSRG